MINKYMGMDRKKNAARNVTFGVLLKLYNMFLPFVMRTVMIYTLGVEYLGLNSLFTSVLQVLNLAELGVGSAMIFSMYKPIVEHNRYQISALLKLYRFYYRIIGLIILIIGAALIPFIPMLISGEVPADINTYILYSLNLLSTVLSYWLFAYRSSILMANQRSDIISKITLVTNTIQYSLQITILLVLRSYYLYVIAILIAQILNNIFTAVLSKRLYPEYEPAGNLDKTEIKTINQRVRDVFTSKLGGTILNSADTIVISAFLGLRILAIYQNYYYILSAIMAIFTILFSSITAGVGNSLVVESIEKNYRDFKRVSLLSFILIGICMSELIVLYQPFMNTWVGQELMLSNDFIILFCAYFLFVEYVQLASVYKEAAGIWHQDRFRPLISAIVNLILNLFLIRTNGLYGIVLSTIISAAVVSAPWITHNLFSTIFVGKLHDYIKSLFRYMFSVIISMVISWAVCNYIILYGISEILVKGAITLFISSIVLLLINSQSEELKELKRIALSLVNK